MRPRFRTLRAKAGLSLASLLLSLLVLEIAFRLLGVQPEFHQPRMDRLFLRQAADQTQRVPYGFVADAMIRTTYDSDPRGYFGPGNSIAHYFNSVGWRDAEHTTEKPFSTFRILGLGDSYLYGQGVKGEDICLSRLAGLLQQTTDATTIETINSGLSSLNTAQERDILVHRGFLYDPDLVILHFVLNDVERSEDLFLRGPKIEFTEEYVEVYNTPDFLSRISHLWGWARQRVLRTIRAKAYVRECLESFQQDSGKWSQCREALSDISRICDEHEVPQLVVIFPFFIELNGDYPFQPIHDTVREFCRSEGIHVLDLRDTFRDYQGPELWVHPTDQHPNEIAHAVAADAMSRYLSEHPGLLRMPPRR